MKGQVDARLLGKLLAHPFLSRGRRNQPGGKNSALHSSMNFWSFNNNGDFDRGSLGHLQYVDGEGGWDCTAMGQGEIEEIVVGGGGVRNRAIMDNWRRLRARFRSQPLMPWVGRAKSLRQWPLRSWPIKP